RPDPQPCAALRHPRYRPVRQRAGFCLLWSPGQVCQGIRGQTLGHVGQKNGNGHLKWAFSEAATLFLRNNAAGQRSLARLEKKHGKGKALTILAHKLARAVYYMLKRQTAFDMETFLHGEGAEQVSLTSNWTRWG